MAPLLSQVATGKPAIARLNLAGKPYFVAAAPIAGPRWNLMLVSSVTEITAPITGTSDNIRRIAAQTLALSLTIMLVAAGMIGILLHLLLRRQLLRPLAALTEVTKLVAAGKLQVIKMPYNDEIGQLAQDFNAMTSALESSRAEILANNQRLEQTVQERTADLEESTARTAAALVSQQELVSTLNRVSSPIIPVLDGVLVLPLIGQLSAERTHLITQLLLEQVEHERVRIVLLDLTGVPTVDEAAAAVLRQAVQGCRLLGAHTIMVGISPDVAQTIVAMDLDWRDIGVSADLRSAIKQILRSRSTSISE